MLFCCLSFCSMLWLSDVSWKEQLLPIEIAIAMVRRGILICSFVYCAYLFSLSLSLSAFCFPSSDNDDMLHSNEDTSPELACERTNEETRRNEVKLGCDATTSDDDDDDWEPHAFHLFIYFHDFTTFSSSRGESGELGIRLLLLACLNFCLCISLLERGPGPLLFILFYLSLLM